MSSIAAVVVGFHEHHSVYLFGRYVRVSSLIKKQEGDVQENQFRRFKKTVVRGIWILWSIHLKLELAIVQKIAAREPASSGAPQKITFLSLPGENESSFNAGSVTPTSY